MKKFMSALIVLSLTGVLLAGCSGDTASADNAETDINNAAAQPEADYTETVAEFGVGVMQVYDFGDVKLHAYKTNDAIDDECFLIESENELVALEAPGFKDNIEELCSYIDSVGKPLNNILLAYHPAGAEALSDNASFIATSGAEAAQQAGGSVKGLIDGFVESFGESYDGAIPEVTKLVEPGTLTIDGVDYVISEGLDGFDVEIPAVNCVFTHMVGADVHNIMPSIAAIDALSNQMQSFIDADYSLILSSHYTPETIDAAKTKLAYTQRLKELAESNDNAEAFIAAVNGEFPDYAGASYLEMTAAGLYQ